jgi:hypothetical protein
MKARLKRALAKLLARVLPRSVMTDPASFGVWERAGYHVTPVHYYSPIPELSRLRAPLRSDCPGVELNRSGQERMLATLSPHFADAERAWEPNTYFDLADSSALFAIVRHYRPKRVVEIGSGYSTRMIEAALGQNGTGELITIEPHPTRMESPPTYPMEVQDVPRHVFEELDQNDILFIDSSHVLRAGGDVHYEYLELLPRLNIGVLVHVHDVFLPDDYPREWLIEKRRFWTEQYVLQAFLALNRDFEVLWSSHMLANRLTEILPGASPGGSFWIRRNSRT